MIKLLIPNLLVGALVVLFGAGNPAFADYLQTYVATTCDMTTGRGMVRFGYGDADDAPKFIEVAPTVDGGLSTIPVANADKVQASCVFPAGREIKVRYEMGNRVAACRFNFNNPRRRRCSLPVYDKERYPPLYERRRRR
jgi:hypothetical protein